MFTVSYEINLVAQNTLIKPCCSTETLTATKTPLATLLIRSKFVL